MKFKFFKKNISLGVAVAAMFVIAAAVYSLGYKMAMDKFNSVVSYTQEKQKMYSTLSEVDYNVRKDYIGEIEETSLVNGLCKGYISGLNDRKCKFLSSAEYKKYSDSRENLKSDMVSEKISDKTGYIRCCVLGKGSAQDFSERLNTLENNGVSSLIVDLRGCESGNMDEAFKILQNLIPSEDAVSLVDKKGQKEVVCKSSGKGTDLKICVIVNAKASGAAEIIASALRDSCKAKLVGAKTAGETAKEKVVNLSDDSVLILSEAHYVTKSGNTIFKKGLSPDVDSEISEENLNLFYKKSLPHDKDSQLSDAVSLLNS